MWRLFWVSPSSGSRKRRSTMYSIPRQSLSALQASCFFCLPCLHCGAMEGDGRGHNGSTECDSLTIPWDTEHLHKDLTYNDARVGGTSQRRESKSHVFASPNSHPAEQRRLSARRRGMVGLLLYYLLKRPAVTQPELIHLAWSNRFTVTAYATANQAPARCLTRAWQAWNKYWYRAGSIQPMPSATVRQSVGMLPASNGWLATCTFPGATQPRVKGGQETSKSRRKLSPKSRATSLPTWLSYYKPDQTGGVVRNFHDKAPCRSHLCSASHVSKLMLAKML